MDCPLSERNGGMDRVEENRLSKLNPVHVNNSPDGATKETGIRRMVYPKSFSQSAEDAENYQEALNKLGGADKSVTKLWWDCKR